MHSFASKAEVAGAVLEQLQTVMREYCYEIKQTLVTHLSPNAKIKASMIRINASRCLKEAASHKAEVDNKARQVRMWKPKWKLGT
jgi:hypothetical protein